MSDETVMLGDRYALGDVLGRGGMAEVRRARDTRLGRDVAIKLLRTDLAGDPTFQARFRREAQSAAGLNHPTIVSVYDTGTRKDPGSDVEIPFIVMELVEGHTLREVLRDGRRILPERALELTQGVLDALSYSHKAGIIHRDIKPANVMLTQTGGVKVMDFGIARAVADTSATMTQTAAVIGTAQYLSPEQARGETVDARSDIYSAGCTLYELLTGRPPFQGDSPVSVAYQHVRETPVAPSKVDEDEMITPAMDAIVLKALAKDPAERYQSARDMKEDISRLLAGDAVTAVIPAAFAVAPAAAAATQLLPASHDTPLTSTQTAPLIAGGYAPAATAPRSRNPLFTALLTVLILALLATAGWMGYTFWKSSQPPPPAAQVSLPGFKGYTEKAAKDRIAELRLVAGTTQHVAGPADATLGQVTAQTPPGGTLVNVGTTVTLTVNDGPGQKTIPANLYGMKVADALNALTNAGFTAKVVQRDAVNEDPKAVAGTVVESDPTPGAVAAPDTPITLSVATGKSEVPNEISNPLGVAQKELGLKGFDNIHVTYMASGTAPVGTVINQDPKSGLISRDSLITLTVATAPATVSAPPPPPTTPPATTPTTPKKTP